MLVKEQSDVQRMLLMVTDHSTFALDPRDQERGAAELLQSDENQGSMQVIQDGGHQEVDGSVAAGQRGKKQHL